MNDEYLYFWFAEFRFGLEEGPRFKTHLVTTRGYKPEKALERTYDAIPEGGYFVRLCEFTD